DAVRTRMYRSFAQLREGWTKNLAILFPAPGRLAAFRAAEFLLLLASIVLLVAALAARDFLAALLIAIVPLITLRRIARAHFSWSSNLLVLFGLPLFSYLLLRSKIAHARGAVTWKGRAYGTSEGKSEVLDKLNNPEISNPAVGSRKPEAESRVSIQPLS
ncbi:MAG TPA: hypothetical protein VMD76_13255, partial [Candidatus Sulfotelmatobacter sp.]|nr:hypothetical protein [Candidatus Sulfotelmatobacter sp.]